ncbi:MAG: hypothetical protein MUC43_04385 [Pirellula sp.]|jgi:hypothetical protein|nr:hypothetical protein [Pirellula sp.]
MRSERSKKLLIGVSSLMLAVPGCVSIRHENELALIGAGSHQTHLPRNQCSSVAVSVQECGDPCRRPDSQAVRGIGLSGIEPTKPIRIVASGVKNGANRVCSSLIGFKERVHFQCNDWWSRQKEKNNPPPWPKFHPVPAKPAFESQTGDIADSPEIFGAFGPAKEE